ncbi:uncharacterized protein Z518_00408 [Rhinocladiella mackenziei CBS 650.93]|uniref:Nucleoside phosphorylase domain-containing protein n=1 Tax=Rhinocladiella mackenziei CBS 650.93 TaxID=1442369 RepID=A0A0D2ITE3_9EURO|nr:uncharacterized protein Z518_00408 [Rhinocladiella mackenziei CBS 650.93]KIX09329.1 hypothetical protein Z518_00408 [Rhinocladiella mackenziei CBS 650.93]
MACLLRPQSRDAFEIAIICALPVERNAVEALLDEEYETDGFSYGEAAGDWNIYTTGRLGNQHVVLVYMPGMGTSSATAVAANLRSSFERTQVGIIVGICGGVPTTADGAEILLGDVIIRTSVIQIDFGSQYSNGVIRKKEVEDTLGRANPEIRAFVGKMSGYLFPKRLQEKTSVFLTQICTKEGFSGSAYPGPENDKLYPANYRHKHRIQCCDICDHGQEQNDDVCDSALRNSCENLACDETSVKERKRILRALGISPDGGQLTAREIQDARKPSIHVGRIACSNQVMKSGLHRDRIATEEKVIGFEMESAGTWDYVPTIVIKSACDYADSHKSDRWHAYAAATAAACTKAVLEEWRRADRPVGDPVDQERRDPNSIANPVHWTVTRSANTLFTGRDDILQELDIIVRDAAKNSSHRSQCRIVISGIGGQGKSEICLQLAQRVRQSTSHLAETGFLDIASRLHILARTWKDARQGLANLKEPWLLILDNADNQPHIDYQPYFPTAASGVVILTSRNAECRQYATAKWVDLEGLSDAEARQLLLRAAHIPHDQHQTLKDDAHVVALLLRSHPLALIQAGSYVSRGHCTLKEYPIVYEQQRKRLLTFRPFQAQSRYRDVYATFEASAEILQSSNTESANDALQLLPVFSSFGPSRLPRPLFEAGWKGAQAISSNKTDEGDLSRLMPWHVSHLPPLIQAGVRTWDSFRLFEAIYLLKAFSLVSTDSNEGFLCVSMHPLIHAWARDRLSLEQQHECWITTGCLITISRKDIVSWQKIGRQLRPHLQTMVSWEMSLMFSSEPSMMVIRILMNCGWLLYEIRDDAKVFVLMDRLFTYLGLDRLTVDPRWLQVYDLTARNFRNYGKIKEAVSLLEQVVKIQEQTPLEDRPDRADTGGGSSFSTDVPTSARYILLGAQAS